MLSTPLPSPLPGVPRRGSGAALQELHDLLADDVGFKIERPADVTLAEVCHFERRWNQGNLELISIQRRDRQADAVDANRALRRQILRQMRRRFECQSPL